MAVVLALTLLRAIGHVLKSESDDCLALKGALDATWPQKKQESIFADFVEHFRNRVVKEYRSAVQSHALDSYDGRGSRMEYPITEGAFCGRDFRHVVDEAIAWWETYITELEEKAYASRQIGLTTDIRCRCPRFLLAQDGDDLFFLEPR